MSLADLQMFFNPNTAIVFFDVRQSQTATTMTKVVAYISKYDPDLNNVNNPQLRGDVLPYRELYSTGPVNSITLFRGSVSDSFKAYGTNPLSSAPSSEKANPFQTKFPSGVRLQFAILPFADQSKPGDIVGVAQVWTTATVTPSYDSSTQKSSPPSLTIPIYRAGATVQVFKNAPVICTGHYVATLGAKPFSGGGG